MTTDPVITALTGTIEALEKELAQLEQAEQAGAADINKIVRWLAELGGNGAQVEEDVIPDWLKGHEQPRVLAPDDLELEVEPAEAEPLAPSEPVVEEETPELPVPDWPEAEAEAAEPLPPPIEPVAEEETLALPVPDWPEAEAEATEPLPPPPIEPVDEASGGDGHDAFAALFGDDEAAAPPALYTEAEEEALPNLETVAVAAPAQPVKDDDPAEDAWEALMKAEDGVPPFEPGLEK